ncbi:MAG: dTMP kinase [Verrucomicrobiaceae bacterium]|nr:dTMP kinase [Verrucomicrobiaceae bacterium]
MSKGIFITFEGSEGCGKSTHINLLKEYLTTLGFDCICTREPGGSPLSEKIRELLLFAKEGYSMDSRTEILLFEAARSQHVSQTILPALNEGKAVLCDRFFDSTTAYQGAARNIDDNSVNWLNNFATNGLQPDLTIVLDLPVEEGLKRANKRDSNKADRMGSQSNIFYENVRNAFLELAKTNPNRFAVVSALGTKEETFAKIKECVNAKLQKNV